MREVTFEESRKIQLEILLYFDEFCKKHNLHYSLAGGTLLGAIRHKGFIPWDDDIDVFMEREQYVEFLKIYQGKYKLITNKHPRWYDGYSRLSDDSTVIQWSDGEKYFHGVWMAILPIDNFPSDEEWMNFRKKLEKTRSFGQYKSYYWNNERGFVINSIKMIRRIILSPFLSHNSKKIDAVLSQYNKVTTKRKANISTWFISNKPNKWPQVFDASCFDGYIRVDFEGYSVESMKYPESYLESTYGNWRQLPPVEERVGLHNYKAYYK